MPYCLLGLPCRKISMLKKMFRRVEGSKIISVLLSSCLPASYFALYLWVDERPCLRGGHWPFESRCLVSISRGFHRPGCRGWWFSWCSAFWSWTSGFELAVRLDWRFLVLILFVSVISCFSSGSASRGLMSAWARSAKRAASLKYDSFAGLSLLSLFAILIFQSSMIVSGSRRQVAAQSSRWLSQGSGEDRKQGEEVGSSCRSVDWG